MGLRRLQAIREGGEIIIPGKINAMVVRSIEDRVFEDCNNLENIIISDSVTNTGKFAFSGCGVLETIQYIRSEVYQHYFLVLLPLLKQIPAPDIRVILFRRIICIILKAL